MFTNRVGEETTPITNIKDAYYDLSLNNLSNFVRITSSAITNFSNMFFIINNMYIPTSYIYKVIVDYLDSEEKRNERTLFEISLFTNKEKEISNSLINKQEGANNIMQEQLLNKIKYNGQSRILFKGLKINNLKSLIKI